VRVLTSSRIIAGGGEGGRLGWVDVENVKDGEVSRLGVDGLFLLLGADPNCRWLPAEIALDPHGFVLTGRDGPRELWVDDAPPADLATSIG
jgi:thioredoxin reductase (NADPH)